MIREDASKLHGYWVTPEGLIYPDGVKPAYARPDPGDVLGRARALHEARKAEQHALAITRAAEARTRFLNDARACFERIGSDAVPSLGTEYGEIFETAPVPIGDRLSLIVSNEGTFGGPSYAALYVEGYCTRCQTPMRVRFQGLEFLGLTVEQGFDHRLFECPDEEQERSALPASARRSVAIDVTEPVFLSDDETALALLIRRVITAEIQRTPNE